MSARFGIETIDYQLKDPGAKFRAIGALSRQTSFL